MPCARCLDKDEVLAQEQLAANDTVEIISHPIMGEMRVVSPSALWRRTVNAVATKP